MVQPNISVYITSYNQKEILIEAIESVLNQTLKPEQIIIVDDCSNDGSQEIISRYVSHYPDLIIPIYHTENKGIANTRIDAIKAATGKYVTYVDGDDRLLPAKLEKEYYILKNNPDARIVFSNFYYINSEGNRTGKIWAQENEPPEGDVFVNAIARDFPRGSLFRNELVPLSCIYKIGFYDPNLTIFEDWDFKIRLTKHFKVVYTQEKLIEYRMNPKGLSKSPPSIYRNSLIKVYEKNLPLLDQISQKEALQVKLRIESLISRIQRPLPKSDHLERYSNKNVYNRNLNLFQQLEIHSQNKMESELLPIFIKLAYQLAWDEARKGNKINALKYWIDYYRFNPRDFDTRWVIRSLFPKIYSKLRKTYHGLRESI